MQLVSEARHSLVTVHRGVPKIRTVATHCSHGTPRVDSWIGAGTLRGRPWCMTSLGRPPYVRTARGFTHHESADGQIDVEGVVSVGYLRRHWLGFCYVGENEGSGELSQQNGNCDDSELGGVRTFEALENEREGNGVSWRARRQARQKTRQKSRRHCQGLAKVSRTLDTLEDTLFSKTGHINIDNPSCRKTSKRRSQLSRSF
ncbi:hypothetical protein LXA43DRAFT_13349 [Ganoderma leucocontextum]|nr:hypothetical protein LXA43DRAFT_13349 [Ganoderma leucocontextum]